MSVWSSYFAVAHLLVRPDVTREVLLNAIWHPYARAPLKVVRAASEEPVAHGGEDEDEVDTGAGRRAGKSCLLGFSFVFLELSFASRRKRR